MANILDKQPCPLCRKKTLTLMEEEMDIPYFGKAFLFSMHCDSCEYAKTDLEAVDMKEPTRYTFEAQNTKDLSVRIVRSSEGTIKLPSLKITIEPGPTSDGFVTNVEGILQRVKKIVEEQRDSAEDDETKKKAKNLLKKIWKIECGDEPVKIIIEDPTGNSAIISEKAIIEKLGKKK